MPESPLVRDAGKHEVTMEVGVGRLLSHVSANERIIERPDADSVACLKKPSSLSHSSETGSK